MCIRDNHYMACAKLQSSNSKNTASCSHIKELAALFHIFFHRRAGAGASCGSSGIGRSPAITARMSSGSKPSPRVDARRRVGLSCPGARKEITPPRPCFTRKPDSSISLRNAGKSAGCFCRDSTMASRTRCFAAVSYTHLDVYKRQTYGLISRHSGLCMLVKFLLTVFLDAS